MIRVISFLLIVIIGFSIFSFKPTKTYFSFEDSLRLLYSRPAAQWPIPNVDAGVPWRELGQLPVPPAQYNDTLRPIAELGKLLFFDGRLSVSNQIACASCHVPELNWTDGRAQAVGHNRTLNKRNTPTIENVWAQNQLFWDGRAHTLEEQITGPITSHTEMNQDMTLLPGKLQTVKGYVSLFKTAYGDTAITSERIVHALAVFQRTVTSTRSRFDRFLAGSSEALSDQELRGLHLYRTKANCMNCHYGPLFTDNDFHNIGLSYMNRPFEDLGRYNITQNTADLGKFKTPSLRNVMRTRPWMHHGLFDDMEGLIAFYNNANPQGVRKDSVRNLPVPVPDAHLHKLQLSKTEMKDIAAFMEAITAAPNVIREPKLPE
ncbi:cytochrome c peroxidase [Filimonas lacunae]|uniref:Methylamine utilization protein MauG n=1 Tax=Filimonas lacunae TaxID=477680 RepID=A0A173MFL1_9BACT|nr:cytochrome c peroxidase [Filimonas lacunae]BAV06280.1 cytochrome c552 peroxidase [Filimonas lacunae]SIT25635.1 cytochrome c peroxidase [Filimonas lacunae]